MDQEQLSILRAALETMLARRKLTTGKSTEMLAQDGSAPADAVDRAAIETCRGIELLMRERELSEMREIERALSRMDMGEYGVCGECGEDIEPRRLRALPMVSLCLACKDAGERELCPRPRQSHYFGFPPEARDQISDASA